MRQGFGQPGFGQQAGQGGQGGQGGQPFGQGGQPGGYNAKGQFPGESQGAGLRHFDRFASVLQSGSILVSPALMSKPVFL